MSAGVDTTARPGALMAAESAEGAGVFAKTVIKDHSGLLARLDLGSKRGFFTIARGSSDAAANILSYEIMRELGIPSTSMPPSVFSLGQGVAMRDMVALTVSQSGASDDLVASVKGARAMGAATLAITNRPGSAVEAAADATLPLGAGPELAVPATKTVIGAIAAGMSLIAAIKPVYGETTQSAAQVFAGLSGQHYPDPQACADALQDARHIYVIGRGAGFGAAQEIALKLKECCALHAEAYSASEVLHGPLQLATRALTILLLDTEEPRTIASMDLAEARLSVAGARVVRLRPSDVGAAPLAPAAAAAALLHLMYPVIHDMALAFGLDPDRPETLAKETLTL